MQPASDTISLSAHSLSVLTEGVALIGADGTITAVNPAMCALLDLSGTDIVGTNVFDPPWQLESTVALPIAPSAGPPAQALRGDGRTVEDTVLLRSRRRATWVRMRLGRCDRTQPEAGLIMAVLDLTPVADAERNLHRLMFTDSLTSLASRDHIIGRVADALESCSRENGRVGVLHVDIDGFRAINDSFGHAVGDLVLVEVAERLRDLADRHVEIGRVGVDEFLLVARGDDPGLAFDTRMRRLAEEVQRRIGAPITGESLELHLTASIGAARGPDDATTAVELIAAADRALRASRIRGRNQFRFHDVTVDIRRRQHLRLNQDLRQATTRERARGVLPADRRSAHRGAGRSRSPGALAPS